MARESKTWAEPFFASERVIVSLLRVIIIKRGLNKTGDIVENPSRHQYCPCHEQSSGRSGLQEHLAASQAFPVTEFMFKQQKRDISALKETPDDTCTP